MKVYWKVDPDATVGGSSAYEPKDFKDYPWPKESDSGGSDYSGCKTVVEYAHSRLGCPYVWGATGPDTFDCSGLTQLATGLMELLANESCAWIAEDGFTAYNVDIETACTVTFYEIAASENGRSGVWRVTYPDGTVKDARFTFTEDLKAGEYVISSWVFPSGHQVYRSKAISGSSMME